MNFFIKLFLIITLSVSSVFSNTLIVETRIQSSTLFVEAKNNTTGLYPLAFDFYVEFSGVKIKTETINNTRYLGTSYCSAIKNNGSYSYFEIVNDGTLFNKTNLNPIFFSVQLEKISNNITIIVKDSPKTRRPIIANASRFPLIPHIFNCSKTINIKLISIRNINNNIFNDIILPKRVRVC